jgi:sugar lactone lactonase YvrE
MIYSILFLLFFGFASVPVFAQTSPEVKSKENLNQTPSSLFILPFRHPAAKLFNSITSLVVDARGALIVADGGDNRIYKLLPNGETTILAGGKRGYSDGKGFSAEFMSISDIAVNAQGEIIVLDGQRVRKVLQNGVVTTLAGFPIRGNNDGKGTEARFNMPNALAVAPDGNIFIADAGNQCLRVIQVDNRVQTVAISFSMVSALTFDQRGRLVIFDRAMGALHRLTPRFNTDAHDKFSFDDSVLVQFPQISPMLNISRITHTKDDKIILLEHIGSNSAKILCLEGEKSIWSSIEIGFSVSTFCTNKNGEIILSNSRNGGLYKVNIGKTTQVQLQKNMTQPQILMTSSQSLMTNSQKSVIK